MIPEWKELRKKSRTTFILNKPYFAMAEEYTLLRKKYHTDDFIDSAFLWFDMIFYPLYIFYQCCMLDFSIMHVFALSKAYQLWIDWLRLRELQEDVDSWVKTVKNLGGPWIASNDPEKHIFVYADAMERILLSRRLGLTKKLRKGAK